jgi:precorrin-3B methylase
MTVTFYLKENTEIEESLTVTIVRKNKSRSQSVNVKKLDDLTATEQQTMRALIAIVEKYRAPSEGAQDMKYGL